MNILITKFQRMSNQLKFSTILLVVLAGLLVASCDSDNGEPSEGSANVRFEITDAPIDDANVQAAFVTISEIIIDGETFAGFEGKQTVDLLALQNGNTETLAEGRLTGAVYSNLELVLDPATDSNGNSPGCYILTTDGEKVNLATNAGAALTISGQQEDLTVNEEGETVVVFDFDLRKAIQRSDSGSGSDYEFVSESELGSAVRVASKEETGMVKGNCTNAFEFSEKVIVYAYPEGSFDKNSEVEGNGNIRFPNAVTSSAVRADGSYELHFLQPGSYELFFAGYKDSDSDNKFEYSGSLELDITGSINLGSVDVSASSSTTFNLSFLSLIP